MLRHCWCAHPLLMAVLISIAAEEDGTQTARTNSSDCSAVELLVSPTAAAPAAATQGYYMLAPRSWPNVSTQSRPAFHQRYCPNATAPSACVGAHFLYFSAGHWIVARRMWSPPNGYHAVLAAAIATDSPGDATSWLMATTGVEVEVAVRCVPPRAAPPRCRRFQGLASAKSGVAAATLGPTASAKVRHIALPPSLVDPATDPSWYHGVHVFPFLDPGQCNQVIDLAEAHAASQGGWRSDRHGKHPTVDIEVRRAKPLQDLLAPSLHTLSEFVSAETLGRSEIDFDDVFVVKYDHSAGGQRSLGIHVDGSQVSFQVALNHASQQNGASRVVFDRRSTLEAGKNQTKLRSEYTGGGTYLQVRIISSVASTLLAVCYPDQNKQPPGALALSFAIYDCTAIRLRGVAINWRSLDVSRPAAAWWGCPCERCTVRASRVWQPQNGQHVKGRYCWRWRNV